MVFAKSIGTRRDALLIVLALFTILIPTGRQLIYGPYRADVSIGFSQFAKKPGEQVLVLSSNVWATFPFVNMVEGNWSSRFPTQWYVPGAMVGKRKADCARQADVHHVKKCAEFDKILAYSRRAIVEDMARYRPDLVIIDARKHKSYFEDIPFEYVPFLRADPAFPAIWSEYAMVDTFGEYQVWRRKVQQTAK